MAKVIFRDSWDEDDPRWQEGFKIQPYIRRETAGSKRPSPGTGTTGRAAHQTPQEPPEANSGK